MGHIFLSSLLLAIQTIYNFTWLDLDNIMTHTHNKEDSLDETLFKSREIYLYSRKKYNAPRLSNFARNLIDKISYRLF